MNMIIIFSRYQVPMTSAIRINSDLSLDVPLGSGIRWEWLSIYITYSCKRMRGIWRLVVNGNESTITKYGDVSCWNFYMECHQQDQEI